MTGVRWRNRNYYPYNIKKETEQNFQSSKEKKNEKFKHFDILSDNSTIDLDSSIDNDPLLQEKHVCRIERCS